MLVRPLVGASNSYFVHSSKESEVGLRSMEPYRLVAFVLPAGNSLHIILSSKPEPLHYLKIWYFQDLNNSPLLLWSAFYSIKYSDLVNLRFFVYIRCQI